MMNSYKKNFIRLPIGAEPGQVGGGRHPLAAATPLLGYATDLAATYLRHILCWGGDADAGGVLP